ncbi:MAG: excinuclease ABC subunit UvrC [Endomicrobiales bacterium]|nr:excinuclease ABC subunit UvrC [Endomicrobiales bacterium]
MITSLDERLKEIPPRPGVYVMRDSAARIIYIGKAKNLKKRVASYFRKDVEGKVAALVGALRHVDFVAASSEREALVLERQLINLHKPYYNSMWRDDKSYPYLRLTVREDFPRLFLTRKIVRDGSLYFGPYPNVMPVKGLLRWLRKVFKWRPCRMQFSGTALPKESKVKSCIYYHTKRCPAPCLGKISSKEYKDGISGVKMFLKGRYSELKKRWEREMASASKDLDYEKAAELRDRLLAVGSMEERVTVKEVRPGDLALSIKTTDAMLELQKTLGLKDLPYSIEAIDISNISGFEPVGSLVRFAGAEPDRSGYRKYRIKSVSGQDDFSMIKEVVLRRYAKSGKGSAFPDLILIDGGKGQLSAAVSALKTLRLEVPVISLAKKEEEVFTPLKSGPLEIDKDSAAVRHLRKVRDEAHRFAVSYHRLRRKKALLGK